MLRASRVIVRPKSIERINQAVARTTNKGPPVKEAKAVFDDLAAQLTPSTREAMAAAKEATKLVKNTTPSEQHKPKLELQSEELVSQNNVEEQMNEIGTS